jgi:hypothetical protein
MGYERHAAGMAGQAGDITLRHIPKQRLDRVSESGIVMNPPVLFSGAAAADFFDF